MEEIKDVELIREIASKTELDLDKTKLVLTPFFDRVRRGESLSIVNFSRHLPKTVRYVSVKKTNEIEQALISIIKEHRGITIAFPDKSSIVLEHQLMAIPPKYDNTKNGAGTIWSQQLTDLPTSSPPDDPSFLARIIRIEKKLEELDKGIKELLSRK